MKHEVKYKYKHDRQRTLNRSARLTKYESAVSTVEAVMGWYGTIRYVVSSSSSGSSLSLR